MIRLPAPFAGILVLITGCSAAVPVASVPPPRPSETVSPTTPGLPTRAAGLVGESSQAVLTTLGPPTLKRDEGTAEFWLYTGKGGCRIDVVLYREGNTEHVAHAAAATPPRISEAACLRTIAAPSAGGPLS